MSRAEEFRSPADRVTALAVAEEAIAVNTNTPRSWALHVQALLVPANATCSMLTGSHGW